MVPPPKYVKAVRVFNTADTAVEVTVEFSNTKAPEQPIVVTRSIAAGASETFEEQVVDMGGWQARGRQRDGALPDPAAECRQIPPGPACGAPACRRTRGQHLPGLRGAGRMCGLGSCQQGNWRWPACWRQLPTRPPTNPPGCACPPQAVCPVKSVSSASGGSNALYAPQASSIVALHDVTVSSHGGALHIAAS